MTRPPAAPPRRLLPVVLALAAQLVGAGLAFGGAHALAALGGMAAPLLAIAAVQGAAAALVGRAFGLAGWWLILNGVLPPAAVGALALALPNWVYLALFFVLLGVFWNVGRGRVPLYLSNRATWRTLDGLLPARDDVTFLDLGSGLGGTLVHLARARPHGRFVGVESAPIPFALAWLRRRLFGPANIELRYGDLWTQQLADYDVVYAFLSPAPMSALHAKAGAEMRSGALFVSNSFGVPDTAPDAVIEVADGRRTRLLVWRM